MKAEALLGGIRDANYHKEGIRCLQLFKVSEGYFEELKCEVEQLCRLERASCISDPGHVTNWTRPRGEILQFSLLNATGRYDDFRADHDLSCFGKRFHGARNYPALAQMVDMLPHAVNCRINLMGAGAGLSAHEEHAVIRTRAGLIGLRTRFHLPITTNPEAELMLEGKIYSLQAGTVYFVNHGCIHSARNGGLHDRIHLVWDMLLTREAFQFMFEDVGPEQALQRIHQSDWDVKPIRSERIQAHMAMPPPVSEDEASHIAWCEVQ